MEEAVKKPSSKWRTAAEIYRHFAQGHGPLDWSESAALSAYEYESRGGEAPDQLNGFYVGKRWMDWHVETWSADVACGLMTKAELYDDATIPQEWLRSWLPNVIVSGHEAVNAMRGVIR